MGLRLPASNRRTGGGPSGGRVVPAAGKRLGGSRFRQGSSIGAALAPFIVLGLPCDGELRPRSSGRGFSVPWTRCTMALSIARGPPAAVAEERRTSCRRIGIGPPRPRAMARDQVAANLGNLGKRRPTGLVSNHRLFRDLPGERLSAEEA